MKEAEIFFETFTKQHGFTSQKASVSGMSENYTLWYMHDVPGGVGFAAETKETFISEIIRMTLSLSKNIWFSDKQFITGAVSLRDISLSYSKITGDKLSDNPKQQYE